MYEFYIDGVLLPVTPSKMQTKISNQNKTINLIDGSEINILNMPGLSEITFDVLLPSTRYPFAVYRDGFKDPIYFLNKLESLKRKLTSFIFLMVRVTPSGKYLGDTTGRYSLEDYTITDDAGEGTDISVSIKLKQYIEYGTKKNVIKTDPVTNKTKIVSSAVKRASSKVIPKTYTVKPGDSLWVICKKELGDGSKYPEIAKLNGISNPNRLTVGQVLKLTNETKASSGNVYTHDISKQDIINRYELAK